MKSTASSDMPLFLNLVEVEELARDVLPTMVHDYYSGAAETQTTARENISIFQGIRLMPREGYPRGQALDGPRGMDMTFPVWIAPMAMHGMAHADRELGTARAAAKAGIPYVLSTMATSSQEELAEISTERLVFQLYVIRNREIVRGWVRNAEALGFKALMITVDAPRLGKREADERNRFSLPVGCELKLLEPLRAAQAVAPRQRAGECVSQSSQADGRDNREGSGLFKLFANEVDDSLTWDFIPWVRSITSLPIILKGILSPEDARLAVDYGVEGLVVSNHGGRQLDYAPTALEVLPAIVQQVKGRIPILVDGGIRRGTDILKALAMGASGVLIGRPILYALALGGESGVSRALQILRAEFELAMALSGCSNISEIDESLLMLPAHMKHINSKL